MPKLPVLTGREVLRALETAGFELIRVKGSHHFLRRSGAPQGVAVPVHGNRDVPAGTLRSIIAQAGLSVDEFIASL